MNRRFLLMVGVLGLTSLTPAFSQKKPLDHSVYDGWKSVEDVTVSPRGGVVAYEVNPQEGDGKLVVRLTKSGQEQEIERGAAAQLTRDERYVVCRIKPYYQQTRQARIAKKKGDQLPKDTLLILDLQTGAKRLFPAISSFKLEQEESDVVAMASTDTALIAKADRKQAKSGKPLLLYRLSSGECDTLRYVDQYAFDHKGRTLSFTTRDARKKRHTVGIYDLKSRQIRTLKEDARFYTLPQFDEEAAQLLFLASADSAETGSKHCALYRYRLSSEGQPECLLPADYQKGLPKGWGINEHARPYFSRDGRRIFLGVAPLLAPKDTTRVSFETAGLDLWSWDATILPPAALKNLKNIQRQTCLALLDEQTHSVRPLTTSKHDRVSPIADGNADYALSVDRTATIIESQWDLQCPQVVSLVSLKDGSRKHVVTGRITQVEASPQGGYICWYDYAEKAWMAYEVATATTRNLSAACGVNFWDEQHDTPSYPRSYGMAGWTEEEKALLVYDRHDLWSLPLDGSQPLCLTNGEGRRTNRRLHLEDLRPRPHEAYHGSGGSMGYMGRRSQPYSVKSSVVMEVYDYTTRKHGFATLPNLAKATTPVLNLLEGYTYAALMKAEKSDLYLYLKSNFQHCPDLYLTRQLGKQEQRLSDINPQQAEYNWGTAELFSWNAYDGTPLEGLLYKPEGFDPEKKYPVMIYFYERRSDNLYTYYAPAPSRSTVNISFYCSRGYVVFVPDIVYKAGIPGECAYNCIVSGAEALARNPWADRERMAIQGQSWGGYQTAYLITRTNLFRAAGSGAPVSNMTSAYGGIRWESGMSRQYQYEHTQSRIGRTLWEAPELYIANSPLFKLPNVQTPVLIMHNDADGAVPWYQGIEMFMGLRRLGKPAWLLQYNNEAHNLVERRNRKDLTIRLQQFFDYYLKDAPMPAWMKTGIPTELKGEYFGLEE